MRSRSLLLAGVTTVALTAGSVSAIAATRSHAGNRGAMMGTGGASATCVIPRLAGAQVTVMLGDMSGGTMMGGRSMMGDRSAAGWMMLHAVPSRVAAGTVSIRVLNHGSKTHELVVLPLASGGTVGNRSIGSGNKVSEQGSLGEASNNCGAGSGEGIKAGSAGWVTLNLKPGRYELLCNLPSHYAAGMYAELDVT
jgi:uncharacterized cupredoxin-like copper-binding protein